MYKEYHMKTHWAHESLFYHIYPLGMLGALYKNNHHDEPVSRLTKITGWIEHIKSLHINALYLGPLFESDYHGYETVDYNMVDRRLGTNEDLKNLVRTLHENGIKVVLDGVFNHCGRDFFAFRDMLINRDNSHYRDWFQGVDFNKNNRFNDGFSYNTWNGHLNLVKFNHANEGVKNCLFNAIENWINYFDIDGLRLDAADCIDIEFLKELSSHCKKIRKDFWLLGEVIHGNYNKWANSNTLDAVTNYECYKGLFSSHNDDNYFEIAYSLKRQFGENGIYKGLYLYNFVDNHDVNRVATILKDQSHLYPLYILLYTMPGIPSIYYGSEYGIEGGKTGNSDDALRPAIDKDSILSLTKNPDLLKSIKKLSWIKNTNEILKYGNYEEIIVAHKHFVFKRTFNNQSVIIAVNSSPKSVDIELDKLNNCKILTDQLNENETIGISNGKAKFRLYPNWGRIMLAD